MSKQLKDYVLTGTCKIVTEATNDRIEAAKVLFASQVQSLKSTFVVGLTIATLSLGLFQWLLNYMKT